MLSQKVGGVLLCRIESGRVSVVVIEWSCGGPFMCMFVLYHMCMFVPSSTLSHSNPENLPIRISQGGRRFVIGGLE